MLWFQHVFLVHTCFDESDSKDVILLIASSVSFIARGAAARLES
jgi:hypothetical protein